MKELLVRAVFDAAKKVKFVDESWGLRQLERQDGKSECECACYSKGEQGGGEGRRARRAMSMAERGNRQGFDQAVSVISRFTSNARSRNKEKEKRQGEKLWMVIGYRRLHHKLPH